MAGAKLKTVNSNRICNEFERPFGLSHASGPSSTLSTSSLLFEDPSVLTAFELPSVCCKFCWMAFCRRLCEPSWAMILDSNPQKLHKKTHETTIACNNRKATLASFAGRKPFCGSVSTMGRQKKVNIFCRLAHVPFFETGRYLSFPAGRPIKMDCLHNAPRLCVQSPDELRLTMELGSAQT